MSRVPHLTAIEIDHRLAESLEQRVAGTNDTVVERDATDMPFADGSFSAAVCFTMLHHVPSTELQDRLLARAGFREVDIDWTRRLTPSASALASRPVE